MLVVGCAWILCGLLSVTLLCFRARKPKFIADTRATLNAAGGAHINLTAALIVLAMCDALLGPLGLASNIVMLARGK